MLKYAKLFLVILLLTGCSQEQIPKTTTPLIIKTTNVDVRFMVEVANSPEDLKTGLMHRTNLGFNSGMIFNIYPVRPTAMWMKNTKIPLDILFIGPDTSIIMIKENATPMSEEHIICKEPVRAVLEINAGQVKRHGIKIGDKVTHVLLSTMIDVKTPGPEASAQATTPTAPKDDIVVPTIKAPQSEPSAPTAIVPKDEPPVSTDALVVSPKVPVPAPSL